MDNVIQVIAVTDGNGDEQSLYEYQHFEPHLKSLELRREAGKKRFMLATGEAVRRVDDDVFEIAATGERLSRIT